MNTPLAHEVTLLHAQVCGGLADPNRIMILYELSDGPRNVTELSTSLGLSQPLVSRHLKILRDRGMVIANRHGSNILYSLSDERLTQALDLLRLFMRESIARRAALIGAVEETAEEEANE